MDDTTYTFISDIREKKSAASGARHRVCGAKSKKCTLPHEKLTPAQLRRRNGPVKTYSCSRPCTYEEFKSMPNDIKKFYIRTCVDTFGGSTALIAKMFGVTRQSVDRWYRTLGLKLPYTRGDKEKWAAFLMKADAQTQEEPAVVEPELPDVPEAEQAPAPIIRTNASIHLSYTGTPYQVLSFLLNCSIGQDDSQVFDIDITFTDHKEA